MVLYYNRPSLCLMYLLIRRRKRRLLFIDALHFLRCSHALLPS